MIVDPREDQIKLTLTLSRTEIAGLLQLVREALEPRSEVRTRVDGPPPVDNTSTSAA